MSKMADANVVNIYIFVIRKKRSFILSQNIQGVPFKKVEVVYVSPFSDAILFFLILSKENIEKNCQVLYLQFSSILNSKGCRYGAKYNQIPCTGWDNLDTSLWKHPSFLEIEKMNPPL